MIYAIRQDVLIYRVSEFLYPEELQSFKYFSIDTKIGSSSGFSLNNVFNDSYDSIKIYNRKSIISYSQIYPQQAIIMYEFDHDENKFRKNCYSIWGAQYRFITDLIECSVLKYNIFIIYTNSKINDMIIEYLIDFIYQESGLSIYNLTELMLKGKYDFCDNDIPKMYKTFKKLRDKNNSLSLINLVNSAGMNSNISYKLLEKLNDNELFNFLKNKYNYNGKKDRQNMNEYYINFVVDQM